MPHERFQRSDLYMFLYLQAVFLNLLIHLGECWNKSFIGDTMTYCANSPKENRDTKCLMSNPQS